MGVATGLHYEALKDFVRWRTPEGYDTDDTQRKMIPVLLELGNHYCNALNTQKK